MGKDGRGTPGRVVLKEHQPKLTLHALLRRRRSSLASFVKELGVTTHAGLARWCDRMGVVSPTQAEFEAIFPQKVNSPMEGVVVLEAPLVVDSETGNVIDVSVPDEIPPGEPIEVPPKKPRKRKDDQPSDP